MYIHNFASFLDLSFRNYIHPFNIYCFILNESLIGVVAPRVENNLRVFCIILHVIAITGYI